MWLVAVAGALAVAAAVLASWWLGVWGALAFVKRRVEVLEFDVEALKSRWRRTDGQAGAQVKAHARSAEDRVLAELEKAVLEGKGAEPTAKRPLRSVPSGKPAPPAGDVLPGAEAAFAKADGEG